jgi:hypothetical protein
LRLAEPQFHVEGCWLHKRCVESGAGKSIAEAFLQPRNDVSPGMERDRPAEPLCDRSKFIEAMAVVCVIMSDNEMVNFTDFRCKELLPEIGTAIYEQPLAGALDENGRAQAAISGLGWVAFAPIGPDPGNAERGSAPQNADFQ